MRLIIHKVGCTEEYDSFKIFTKNFENDLHIEVAEQQRYEIAINGTDERLTSVYTNKLSAEAVASALNDMMKTDHFIVVKL